MASNPTPDEKPKVSKLPLPISDSPLVIDLPDGQKIVIGKMTQGSVIEVATWRGVGRPDSRTSRLMLGVGNGNVNEDQGSANGQTSTAAQPVKPKDWRIVLYFISNAVSALKKLPISKYAKKISVVLLLKKLNPKIKVAKEENSEISAPEKSVTVQETSAKSLSSVEDDIEAWLSKISEKASLKADSSSKTTKSALKKSAPLKKTVKRTATSKAKRK